MASTQPWHTHLIEGVMLLSQVTLSPVHTGGNRPRKLKSLAQSHTPWKMEKLRLGDRYRPPGEGSEERGGAQGRPPCQGPMWLCDPVISEAWARADTLPQQT